MHNHKSADQNAQFVDQHVAEEKAAGRIVSPCHSIPEHCIVSPLGLVPKHEAGLTR